MPAFSARAACLLAACLCALALGAAVGSERFLQLVPCALCLLQRWPYRLGIALGLACAALPARLRALGPVIMALTFLGAAVPAAIHIGVEQKWWPSPLPECTAPDLTGLSLSERFARMPLRPSMSCEDPTYILGPVTMAEANLGYALAGAATMLIWVARNLGRNLGRDRRSPA